VLYPNPFYTLALRDSQLPHVRLPLYPPHTRRGGARTPNADSRLVHLSLQRNSLTAPFAQLFTRPAAQAIFPPLHLANWIFDIELLLASHLCIPVKEVPVHWQEVAGSKLNVATATIGMVYDSLVMRLSYAVGRWSAWDGYVGPGGQANQCGSESEVRIGRGED